MPSHSPVPDEHACLSCGSTDVEVFHQEAGVPVNSCLLLASEAEARAFPRGAIRLGFCHACGFIANTAFDQALAEYSTRYEETQGFSPRFQRFADDLAHRLVDRFDLHDKDILEIGCGKGEFLLRVCELGNNRGVGVDPSVVLDRVRGPAADRVSFIADLYRKQHADLPADFVICRHTLEHISEWPGSWSCSGPTWPGGRPLPSSSSCPTCSGCCARSLLGHLLRALLVLHGRLAGATVRTQRLHGAGRQPRLRRPVHPAGGPHNGSSGGPGGPGGSGAER